jgi:predicted PurR-regulated permease PerM
MDTIPTEPPRPGGRLGSSTLMTVVVAGAGLYLAREVLVPLALATLLSFMLAPALLLLRRIHIGRVPAVFIVVAGAFAIIVAFGAAITTQLGSLAQNLSSYQYNAEAKIHSLQSAFPGGGLIKRASTVLQQLNQELTQPRPTGDAAAPGKRPVAVDKAKPLPVEIWEPEQPPIRVIKNVLSPLLSPLATSGLILLLVVVMLLHREDLRDRVIRLAGAHDLHRTTQALNDAGERVSRYLLMQLMINAGYAVPIGVGLAIIGVPNPLLWALLAMIFRFVPYIGPVVGAIFPLILAIAVDPGWSLVAWTAALFVGLELVTANVIEPWIYGSSTGLSAVAVIFSAVVWTWLWGPVGLLLSTPVTVCLVVLGRHVPQLEFLDVLLGNEAVLTAPERFYQRLLADDPDEATEQAEAFLKEAPAVAGFYDAVAMPALGLAEYDRARGALDDSHRDRVADSILTVIDNLSERVAEKTRGDDRVADQAAEPRRRDGTVLCIGARGSLDEAAASMLAQLLVARAIEARVVPSGTIGPRALAKLDFAGVRMICLSYLNSSSLAHARYLSMRLRRRAPGIAIVVGFWNLDPASARAAELQKAIGAAGFATSLSDAVTRVTDLEVDRGDAASVGTPHRSPDNRALTTGGAAVG